MINVRYLSGVGLSLAAFGLVCACDNPLPTAPSGPYTLSGVVTQMTSSGRVPIAGVFVEGRNIYRQAVTDESGRYRMANLPAGDATIQLKMLRFESASRIVDVRGDTTLDVELQLREQFTLSGFVTEETTAGRVPIAGVLVQAIACPPDPRGGHSYEEAETDTNGFYSISGMCDGMTTLFAWKLGYDLPRAFDKPCGNEGEWCRYITIAGNTRFDFQLNRN